MVVAAAVGLIAAAVGTTIQEQHFIYSVVHDQTCLGVGLKLHGAISCYCIEVIIAMTEKTNKIFYFPIE